MLEDLTAWMVGRLELVVAWYDHLWLGWRVAIAVLLFLAIAGAAHLSDLRSERLWADFRRWREREAWRGR